MKKLIRRLRLWPHPLNVFYSPSLAGIEAGKRMVAEFQRQINPPRPVHHVEFHAAWPGDDLNE